MQFYKIVQLLQDNSIKIMESDLNKELVVVFVHILKK